MIPQLLLCRALPLQLGLIGVLSQPWLPSINHAPLIVRIGSLLLIIMSAGLLFGLINWGLKIEGFSEFLGIVSRKLKKQEGN